MHSQSQSRRAQATPDGRSAREDQDAGRLQRGSRYVIVWRQAAVQRVRHAWLDGYQGRTARGFSDQTRSDYRRSIEDYAIPFFEGSRLCDVEQPDVRRFISSLQAHGQ